MRIFIYDDKRTIRQAMTAVNLAPGTTIKQSYTLVRPTRVSMGLGEYQETHDDAIDCIRESDPFDLWVLDNDLGEGLEGYHFLRQMIERYPDKVPLDVLSCSANPARAAAIVSYHQNWLKCR